MVGFHVSCSPEKIALFYTIIVCQCLTMSMSRISEASVADPGSERKVGARGFGLPPRFVGKF